MNIVLLPIIFSLLLKVQGLGYMSTIAASYGNGSLVCAIEASGGQQVLCWGRDNNQVGTMSTSVALPFVALSGGNGFMCGLVAGQFHPFCWRGNQSGQNIIPQEYQSKSYESIASGDSHVCATSLHSGSIDCWNIDNSEMFPAPGGVTVQSIVAGNGFSCGIARNKSATCWGDSYNKVEVLMNTKFASLAAGRDHVCGLTLLNGSAICWGENAAGQANPPSDTSFVSLTAGYFHTCGILSTTHEILCWGDLSFDYGKAVPSGTQFLALSGGENVTCGVREDNLLAACWGENNDYQPPLQLLSPGICASNQCGGDEFSYNATRLDSTLPSVCMESSQRVCVPCTQKCPGNTFLLKNCTKNSDLVCQECSLCETSRCQTDCLANYVPVEAPSGVLKSKTGSTGAIVGAAVAGGGVFLGLVSLLTFVYKRKIAKTLLRGAKGEAPDNYMLQNSPSLSYIGSHNRRNSNDVIPMQTFRLSELRDATNGFKELNELGRGSYGCVYKATLPDGRQVAVKRANAARRIHSTSRDFDSELEILCKVRHTQLVNFVGYCEEMGERILVYEFMPNGTLHDHLHGGLAQLNWGMRFRVALQAARGIEYLHKDASPRIVHKDIKSSNVLLDGEWNARVADFGLAGDHSHTMYNVMVFNVVFYFLL